MTAPVVQYTDEDDTWVGWLAENDDALDVVKLIALREIIYALAKRWASSGEISAGWANKKLPQLGITEQIVRTQPYVLQADVTAVMDLRVYATSRAEAQQKAIDLLSMNGGGMVRLIKPGATAPTFVDGPEDPDPAVLDDAPATVDGTLMKLREIVMLGNIAGPRWDCESGTNTVLASFGLDPLPSRKQFTVGVPVEAVMKTTVEAYDDESALRVAGWRWDSGQSGYYLDQVTDTNAAGIVPVAS